MFVDTHCHLQMLERKGYNLGELYAHLAAEGCVFLLDAGTRFDDVVFRVQLITLAETFENFPLTVRLSAGIWPEADAIENRVSQVTQLENNIVQALKNFPSSVCAVGECGVDHHWNKGSQAELELFALQVQLAKKLQLPVIVHSRDAFDETFEVLKDCAVDKGIIHCFSYSKKEAERFLDLGMYISLAGSITYGKGARRAENEQLIRFIPSERLLLETDAPYLAPLPFRGKINNPALITYIYDFAAQARNIDVKTLADLILKNTENIFSVSLNVH